MDAIIGGWQLGSTFQFHTGLPFTPVMGTANLSGRISRNLASESHRQRVPRQSRPCRNGLTLRISSNPTPKYFR